MEKIQVPPNSSNSSLNKLNNSCNSSTCKTGKSYAQVDDAVEQCSDLVNPTYFKWHCGVAHKLGVSRYLEVARLAREGLYPQRLFSYLLKQELNPVGKVDSLINHIS